ncbi:MAG: SulP family inorganic anion transporter [Caldilineaceae bacterium]
MAAAKRRLPLLSGVLPLSRAQIPADILGGITLAALAIPEVMGYTKIAGTPVVTGLYTLLIPMALFAIFGSSRHLVVAADSATAAIMAAGLAGLAATGSPQYMAYAGVLALLAGAFLLIARVVRLGFLADFLSRTVLIGFLTGVGIQVAVGQISGMLGIPGGSSDTVQKLLSDLQELDQTNPYALATSVAVLVIVIGARLIDRRVPGALIAVLGGMFAGYAGNLPAHGVALLGPVPGGLPHFGLPQADLNWAILQELLGIAFAMFIVILAQSAATSRAYATRYGEDFSEDVDLVGLSIANLGAGLSGTFVVNGSPTKTQMVDGAGGRTQVAQITTCVIVLLVLLFGTAPLAYLPEAVLAAVVFLIGVELVDIKGMRQVRRERPAEFWVALLTAATVVFVGVEQGIILAVLLSLLVHTRHGYQARNFVLEAKDGHFYPVPLAEAVQSSPGLVLYRFNHSMYYANARQLDEEIGELARLGPTPVRWLCLDLAAVDDVDFSAAATLREICTELKDRSIRLLFANVADHVRHELDVSGITGLVGADAFYLDQFEVLSAYRRLLAA